ncbi:MAG: TVP38/TMEM64 family protein [Pseudomonadota bacterium]
MTEDADAVEPPKSLVTRFAPIVVIIIALTAFLALDLGRFFTLDALRENRQILQEWVATRPALAMGAFFLVYASAVAISAPGASIMTVFGGFMFGLFPGVPLVVAAATTGALVIYAVAKSAFGDTLLKNAKAGGFAERMEAGFRENELSYMLLLRLTPVFPFWAVNIASGLLGVSFRNFLIGTFFGIIPGSFVYASIGNAAGAAFDAGQDVTLSGILLKPTTLLPMIGLALLALLPIILKRFTKTSDTPES